MLMILPGNQREYTGTMADCPGPGIGGRNCPLFGNHWASGGNPLYSRQKGSENG